MALAFLAASLTAQAQDHPVAAPALPEEITLEQVLRLLREHSPWVDAEKAEVRAAEARVIEASTLKNPEVYYDTLRHVHGTNTIDGSQHAAGVEIPLMLAGQRGQRRKAAEAGVQATFAAVEARLAEREAAVRGVFGRLLAAQRRLGLLRESRERLGELVVVVDERTEAGLSSRYDRMRIAVEMAELDTRLEGVRVEVWDLSGELARMLALPGWAPRALGPLEPAGIAGDLETLWREALEAHPLLKAVEMESATASRELAAARRDRFPVPSLVAGAEITTAAYGLAMAAGINLPLPLLDRNQGPIALAAANLDGSLLRAEALKNELRAGLERAVRTLGSRARSLAAFEDSVVHKLPELEKMAEESYRAGRTGIVDLLDAVRSRTDLLLTHVDLKEALVLAEADVLAAAGIRGETPGP